MELAFDVEPIVGYRAFRVVAFQRRGGVAELRIASLTGRMLWTPRQEAHADCQPSFAGFGYGFTNRGLHEAPWPGCKCGIWATRDRDDAEQEAASGDAELIATVFLWGRVLEYEHGWRAEKAYPRTMTLRGKAADREIARELEQLYGIPVTVDATPFPEEEESYGSFLGGGIIQFDPTPFLTALTKAQVAIDLAARQQSRFFQTAARPQGLIKLPSGLTAKPKPPRVACLGRHPHGPHIWKPFAGGDDQFRCSGIRGP